MKIRILSIMLTLGLIFTGNGCTAEEPPQTDFVFDLYRAVAKDQENTAVSPYSAQQVLELVRAGAAGETRAEIEKVLGSTESIKWTESLPDSPLTTAAAVWTQQGHPILPEFLKTAAEEFGASAEPVDFSGNPAEAVKRINTWCSEKTKEKIPVLFDQLDATTRCVLAGAVHFAADWKMPFDKDATLDASFTLLDGTQKKTKIMSQTGQMKYAETDETLILELPYKNEGYAMLLLLPKDSEKFTTWEKEITSEKWNTLRAAMQPEQVGLRMPRFTVECDLAMNEPLKQLGMPTALSRDADFSKIDGKKDLYLSEVRQKVFVNVDETGTEAAAATAAVIAVKSAPLNLKPFYADRPFLYAVVKENTILFLGRFIQPETETPFIDPDLSGEGGSFN